MDPLRNLKRKLYDDVLDKPVDPVRRALIVGGLSALLAACVSRITTPVVSPTATPTNTPTSTPAPTSTPTPRPSPTPKGFPEPPEPIKPEGDFNIGTYYITGWGTFTGRSSDWNIGQPYTPLLGFYKSDDPRIADWHIYWLVQRGTTHINVGATFPANEGDWSHNFEKGFLNSALLPHMKFSMMYNNAPFYPGNPFGLKPEDVHKQTAETISYFTQRYFPHPQYKKVDGDRPIVGLFCADCLTYVFSMNDLKRVVDDIRETAMKNGYNPFIIGDVMTINTNLDSHNREIASLFDMISAYYVMNAGAGWDRDENGNLHIIAPYDDMVQGMIEVNNYWSQVARSVGVKISPLIQMGFDNEILNKKGIDNWLVKRTDTTPEKYREMVEGTLQVYLRNQDVIHPEIGILESHWNEYQEGVVVEPTVEKGFGYTNIIRDVFYKKPQSGWSDDLVPTSDRRILTYKDWIEVILHKA